MQLQSVRELKADLAQSIVAPAVRAAEQSGRLSVRAASLRSARGPRAAVALGIAAGSRRKDFRLAVRLQRQFLADDPTIVGAIREAAKQEVDVRYVGRLVKLDGAAELAPWHRQRQRPLLIGGSIAHLDVTAGTLGAFAVQRKTLKTVILSNNHVLANENKGKIGDEVVQPGPYDGGLKGRDRVGALADFAPLKTAGANLIDAAIASLDSGIAIEPSLLTGLGRLSGTRSEPLLPGDLVRKIGRTTGLTEGRVTAVELDDVVVDYDLGTLSFDGQIEVEGAGDTGFSAGGDSGSLIVDEALAGCALLFAGGDTGGTNGRGLTFANPLEPVLSALDIRLAI